MNIYAFSYCTYTEYVAAKDKIGALSFYNADNMAIMKTFKDKEFDLAIIDPPYGINMDGGKIGGDNCGKAKNYTKKDWDKTPPTKQYFDELFRVSKNQIVFGANHFISLMPYNSSCWIVWDKDNTGNFADCELAWASFDTAVRKFKWRWNGMLQQNMKDKQERIHPTEKPIQVYEWLLNNYANENDKIIDTHLGSGSIAIAIDKANTLDKKNLTFVGIELDTDYYNAALNRFKNYKQQKTIFDAIQD
jgi:site-specific DNA-methyltransferase (adenine-specific)